MNCNLCTQAVLDLFWKVAITLVPTDCSNIWSHLITSNPLDTCVVKYIFFSCFDYACIIELCKACDIQKPSVGATTTSCLPVKFFHLATSSATYPETTPPSPSSWTTWPCPSAATPLRIQPAPHVLTRACWRGHCIARSGTNLHLSKPEMLPLQTRQTLPTERLV